MNASPDSANPFLVPQHAPTSIPKTVGVLHVVFASLMLLCAGCGGLYIFALSFMGPVFQLQQDQMRTAIEREREAELSDLAEAEQAAASEEERAALKSRREELASRPIPKTPDMTKIWSGFKDPRIMGFLWTDLVSGLLLNLAMFISGLGLLKWRYWARLAALWIAAIKIVRLLALYSYYIAAVVPVSVKMLVEMFQDFAPAGGMDPAQLDAAAATYTVQYTAYAVMMMVFGSIYPNVTLWLLTRPQVKAACTK